MSDLDLDQYEATARASEFQEGYAAGYAAAFAHLRERHAAAIDAAEPGESVMCGVCQRPHRNYRRKLNAGMAAVTVRLYALGGGSAMGWVNVVRLFPNTTHRGGEWAQIRHWGLALPRDVRTHATNSPGDWQITPLGVAFVEGRIEVPRYIETRDGELLRKSKETISIMGALGNAFDYAELLRGEG